MEDAGYGEDGDEESIGRDAGEVAIDGEFDRAIDAEVGAVLRGVISGWEDCRLRTAGTTHCCCVVEWLKKGMVDEKWE